MLPGLYPRVNRLMQPAVANGVPAEAEAAQFAMQLLSDLVASGDARSSVWNAQVELLAHFVKDRARHTIEKQLDDVRKHMEDARTRARQPGPLPGTLFVP